MRAAGSGQGNNPEMVLSNVEPMTSVLDAYRAFDERQPGRIKVELIPKMEAVTV